MMTKFGAKEVRYRMPHFFVNSKDIEGNTIRICDVENYRHIAKSLRAREGQHDPQAR